MKVNFRQFGGGLALLLLLAATPSGASIVPDTATIRGRHLSPELLAVLHHAADRTGVDFDFLAAEASLESGFHTAARARGSSATGLFQFTRATWLRMIREYGAKYGYGALSHRLRLHTDGIITADYRTENRILALRRNPELSACLAGEYARSNERLLETALGRKIGPAELHLAHLMGPGGAIHFLRAEAHDGRQSAAAVSPGAARTNPALFYAHNTRRAQTVAVVYHRIEQRLAGPMREAAALVPAPLRQSLGLMAESVVPRTDG